jgi:hypothetical protein
MGAKNKHGIRRKAKGGGKKWRPSPGDPVIEERKNKDRTDWKGAVRDVFRKKQP